MIRLKKYGEWVSFLTIPLTFPRVRIVV